MRNEDKTEEAIYELLGNLAGVETWDVNLRDHPEAYAAVEEFLRVLSDAALHKEMDEDETQPWYDLAWKHGAYISFEGDEMLSLAFTPKQFDSFCAALSGQSAPGKGEDAKDATRLQWFHQTLEWDGHGYWLREMCFRERQYGEEFTPEPTLDEFREAIDAAMSPLDRMQQSDEKRGEGS